MWAALSCFALLAGCKADSPKEHFLPKATPSGTSPKASATAAGEQGIDGPDLKAADGGAPTALSACRPPTPAQEAFSRAALRSALRQCVHHHLCIFDQSAKGLLKAVEHYADNPDAEHKAAAQRAYGDAARAWAPIEVMQFGPLASPSAGAGEDMYQGASLRDRVHSWPLVARCRAESQLLEPPQLQNGTTHVPVSALGLHALEYVLFYGGDDTACTPESATGQAFNTLDGAELARRKRAYAAAVAQQLHEQAQALLSIYGEDSEFAAAFEDATGYPSEQEALNVAAFALLYIEREVKDWKVGLPSQQTLTAPVSQAESPYAGLGGPLILHNLFGFERMFFGCASGGAGLGFDDWLQEAGHSGLVEDLRGAYDRAVRAAERLTADPAAADPELLLECHGALRELTTLLKSEFFGAGSPINLRLPATLEGDTD